MLRVSGGAAGRTGEKRVPVPRVSLAGVRRGVLAAVVAGACLTMAGCGGSHPRTELLRSASPVTSPVYVRITGPGGAVDYTGHHFMTFGGFSKYGLRRDPRGGFFVPPRILDRKLCASTHIIRRGDAPELQRWRGRTLAITVYGPKASILFCAALGPGLYRGGS